MQELLIEGVVGSGIFLGTLWAVTGLGKKCGIKTCRELYDSFFGPQRPHGLA